MPAEAVEVAGLRELMSTLRLLEAELPREMRGELAESARLVAAEARVIAHEEGLDQQRPGDKSRETASLIRGIRSKVKGSTAYVLSTAKRTVGANAPFNYTRIYEYARHRLFMRPALDRRRADIDRRVNDMLARVVAGR